MASRLIRFSIMSAAHNQSDTPRLRSPENSGLSNYFTFTADEADLTEETVDLLTAD